MKVDGKDPVSDNLMITFNGELVGFVAEADTEQGYIVQAIFDWETFTYRGHEKRFGRVDVIGDCVEDSREVLQERLNKVRKEMGLSPITSQ